MHLSLNEKSQIKTNNIEVNFRRGIASSLSTISDHIIGENYIKTPSICEIISNGSDCSGKILTQQVNLALFNLN